MSDNDKKPVKREEIKQQQDSAANLIRTKLDKLYGSEPNAKEEIAEVKALPKSGMSKHQLYMSELTDSNRGLAEIQTAWHEYYSNLSDKEKHEVWQEFYAEHERAKTDEQKAKDEGQNGEGKALDKEPVPSSGPKTNKPNTIYGQSYAAKPRRRKSDVKQQILENVQKRAKLPENHHVRSLIFGLSMGALTVLILLFSFFNERFITPFIRPSHNVSTSPIIVDPNSGGAAGPEAKIIIPKINLEAPVVYDVPTIEEKAVQVGLERGVVHYGTTPNPGEKGNGVIFGHSSSNILNKGKYKFAFILLKSLEEGDTFIVQKDGKKYVYKVYKKFVTVPSDVSVLGAAEKPSTMTLITCDPPGTSTNRLIVIGEQIFPDPAKNSPGKISGNPTADVSKVPSNAPSLWQKIKDWF